MAEKPYERIGDTYYPKKPEIRKSDHEIKGPSWRVWFQDGRYYFEYDAGHFASKFVKTEISREDFLSLMRGTISEHELHQKYRP